MRLTIYNLCMSSSSCEVDVSCEIDVEPDVNGDGAVEGFTNLSVARAWVSVGGASADVPLVERFKKSFESNLKAYHRDEIIELINAEREQDSCDHEESRQLAMAGL
jgi:hypothetical protein